MDLAEIRTMVDFGLTVLIWLVQVIIYPGFHYLDREKLVAWHRIYARRISFFVIPLMTAQVALLGYQTWSMPSLVNIAACFCVAGAWLSTFAFSVPLHQKISQGVFHGKILDRLVVTNWPRTLLWSAVFFLGVVHNQP